MELKLDSIKMRAVEVTLEYELKHTDNITELTKIIVDRLIRENVKMFSTDYYKITNEELHKYKTQQAKNNTCATLTDENIINLVKDIFDAINKLLDNNIPVKVLDVLKDEIIKLLTNNTDLIVNSSNNKSIEEIDAEISNLTNIIKTESKNLNESRKILNDTEVRLDTTGEVIFTYNAMQDSYNSIMDKINDSLDRLGVINYNEVITKGFGLNKNELQDLIQMTTCITENELNSLYNLIHLIAPIKVNVDMLKDELVNKIKNNTNDSFYFNLKSNRNYFAVDCGDVYGHIYDILMGCGICNNNVDETIINKLGFSNILANPNSIESEMVGLINDIFNNVLSFNYIMPDATLINNYISSSNLSADQLILLYKYIGKEFTDGINPTANIAVVLQNENR